MTKVEFLDALKKNLKGLSKEEIDERIGFYSEMIDDRISEGKSEEEAVEELGGVDKVVGDIVKDTPLFNLVKEKMKPKKKFKAWEIVLIILGFPLWFPLLLVFFILCLVGYLLIWVGVAITYSIELGFAGASVVGFIGFLLYLTNGEFSFTYIGMGLCMSGLAILFFFACVSATKGTIKLSKKIIRGIKSSFIKKGA